MLQPDVSVTPFSPFGTVPCFTDAHLVSPFRNLSPNIVSRGEAETYDYNNIDHRENFSRPRVYSHIIIMTLGMNAWETGQETLKIRHKFGGISN